MGSTPKMAILMNRMRIHRFWGTLFTNKIGSLGTTWQTCLWRSFFDTSNLIGCSTCLNFSRLISSISQIAPISLFVFDTSRFSWSRLDPCWVIKQAFSFSDSIFSAGSTHQTCSADAYFFQVFLLISIFSPVISRYVQELLGHFHLSPSFIHLYTGFYWLKESSAFTSAPLAPEAVDVFKPFDSYMRRWDGLGKFKTVQYSKLPWPYTQ